ncbi:MAG: hypothetical protein Q8P67_15610 [archaeon]|nr:hypothetical protein [archaeon]
MRAPKGSSSIQELTKNLSTLLGKIEEPADEALLGQIRLNLLQVETALRSAYAAAQTSEVLRQECLQRHQSLLDQSAATQGSIAQAEKRAADTQAQRDRLAQYDKLAREIGKLPSRPASEAALRAAQKELEDVETRNSRTLELFDHRSGQLQSLLQLVQTLTQEISQDTTSFLPSHQTPSISILPPTSSSSSPPSSSSSSGPVAGPLPTPAPVPTPAPIPGHSSELQRVPSSRSGHGSRKRHR